MPKPDAIGEDDLPAVIRRAVELDVQRSDGEAALDLAVLEQVGQELGLSREAIRQAVAEHRAGRLQADGGATRQLVGPASIRAERMVRGDAAAIWRRIDAFLRSQWLERRRSSADAAVWVPRTGFAADLRRGFDLDNRLRLNDVGSLSVTVVARDSDGDRHLVCLDAYLGHHRSRLAAGLIGTPLAGGAAAGVAGLVLGIPELLIAVPAAAGLSAGGWAAARNAYRRRAAGVEDALAGFLDRLEHRR